LSAASSQLEWTVTDATDVSEVTNQLRALGDLTQKLHNTGQTSQDSMVQASLARQVLLQGICTSANQDTGALGGVLLYGRQNRIVGQAPPQARQHQRRQTLLALLFVHPSPSHAILDAPLERVRAAVLGGYHEGVEATLVNKMRVARKGVESRHVVRLHELEKQGGRGIGAAWRPRTAGATPRACTGTTSTSALPGNLGHGLVSKLPVCHTLVESTSFSQNGFSAKTQRMAEKNNPSGSTSSSAQESLVVPEVKL
jgi:hypothetical protein